MLIHTSFSIDDRTGITFYLWFNPSLDATNWQFIAHLAWVLNAYMSAERVLKILNPPYPTLHSVPLNKWLSPRAWENLIYTGWHR